MYSVPEQNISLCIYNLKNNKIKTFNIGRDFKLTPFGTLGNFKFGPGGHVARTNFSDVLKGNFAFELNIKKDTLKLLKNKTNLNFDYSKVHHELVKMKSNDGTNISGRLYYNQNKKPSFVYIRYYGWISIKNSPEQREVQMAIEAGGAYLTIDLPGGGERGQKWFIEGSRYRKNSFKYISEMSTHLQNKLNLEPKQVVAMGRSWGGLSSINLAAKFGSNFGMINPVVPVIDIKDMLSNGWFGRIAHSDFAPRIDNLGNYILNENFYDYLYSMSPKKIIKNIPSNLKINLFTSGLDDRVDQGGKQEVQIAKSIEDQIGSSNFYYHRSIKGNHGNRDYQMLIMSLIVDHYKTNYVPLVK
jgi:protease II